MAKRAIRKVTTGFSATITRQLVKPAGVTRLRLSQSRDCTSRTGRSAGVFDARSRPGTVCETARGDRACSTFRIASGMCPSMSKAGCYMSPQLSYVKDYYNLYGDLEITLSNGG